MLFFRLRTAPPRPRDGRALPSPAAQAPTRRDKSPSRSGGVGLPLCPAPVCFSGSNLSCTSFTSRASAPCSPNAPPLSTRSIPFSSGTPRLSPLPGRSRPLRRRTGGPRVCPGLSAGQGRRRGSPSGSRGSPGPRRPARPRSAAPGPARRRAAAAGRWMGRGFPADTRLDRQISMDMARSWAREGGRGPPRSCGLSVCM